MKRILTLTFALVCCLGLAVSAQARSYTFTNLGSLSSGFFDDGTVPYAINNNGQVVGTSNGRAFLWENGQMTALPGGGGFNSVAYDINDSGQVVGFDNSDNVVMWQGNQQIYVSSSMFGVPHGTIRPVNINNDGVVAYRQTLWQNGAYSSPSMASLGVFSGLNNNGQLIGHGDFSYQLTGNIVTMLGYTSSTGGKAHAINDSGVVVGSASSGAPDGSAVIWNGSVPQYLGTILDRDGFDNGSVALSINSQGMVVGVGGTFMLFDEFATNTAFLYDPTTNELIDLNAVALAGAAGMYLAGAIDINDKGQIIGVAFANNGDGWVEQGFLLTPTPIPGAVWLLGTGLFGIIGLRRKLN